MKAEEFVKRLVKSIPQAETMLQLGMTQAFVDSRIRHRSCTPRETPLKLSSVVGSEDLIDLFNRWNPGTVVVGMIELLDQPKSYASKLQIGVEETEPLLIASNGEIIVEEQGTKGHILGEVAVNGNKFLDSLIVAAEFLSKRVVKIIDFEDFAAAKAAARECATAAGGEKYFRFYSMLLGADE